MAVNSTALRYFVKVAELGSFRSASEALHIAASAVNRQIVQMEEELGAQLFERYKGRKNLRLTAAGETLLVHARSVLYEIKRAHEQIDALKGLRAGSVVVGVPETFARDFMPRVLAEFHERLPGITFNVVVDTSQRLIELLARDEIEVAMCYDPPRHQDLVYVADIERAVHAMMPADHPLAMRERLRLSDGHAVPEDPASDGLRAGIREGGGEASDRSRDIVLRDDAQHGEGGTRRGADLEIHFSRR